MANQSTCSKNYLTYCRYDYGNNIIGYDNCDSTYDPSTDDHIDWRKNLCPTDTYKMTTTEPVDGNLVEWNTTELTPIKDKVYAIRYVTTTSKFKRGMGFSLW